MAAANGIYSKLLRPRANSVRLNHGVVYINIYFFHVWGLNEVSVSGQGSTVFQHRFSPYKSLFCFLVPSWSYSSPSFSEGHYSPAPSFKSRAHTQFCRPCYIEDQPQSCVGLSGSHICWRYYHELSLTSNPFLHVLNLSTNATTQLFCLSCSSQV